MDSGIDILNNNSLEVNLKFFSYVDDIYRILKELRARESEVALFNYMRFGEYNGDLWNSFLGPEPSRLFDNITEKMISKNQAKYEVKTFENGRKFVIPPNIFDHKTGASIDPQHIAAVAVGSYSKLKDDPNFVSIIAGEYTGWAGDLATLFGEYNSKESSYSRPQVFIDEYFGNFSDSTFKYSDLLEDVLGYLIARDLLSNRGRAISEFKSRISHKYAGNVLNEFFQGRFRGSESFLRYEIRGHLGYVIKPVNKVLVLALLRKFSHRVFNLESEAKIAEFSEYLAKRFMDLKDGF